MILMIYLNIDHSGIHFIYSLLDDIIHIIVLLKDIGLLIMNNLKRNIVKYTGIFLILVGMGVLSYHFINNYFIARRETEILSSWEIELENRNSAEISEESSENQGDNSKLEETVKIVDPEQKLPFKIIILEIDLEWIVNEGTDSVTLKKGPGFYLASTLPGEDGTTVVSGHRTTYGAPFNRLDELEAGDEIIIETIGNEQFIYTVTRSEEVPPTDMSVLENTDHPSLVLSTCTPKYFATRRLIIFAEIKE